MGEPPANGAPTETNDRLIELARQQASELAAVAGSVPSPPPASLAGSVQPDSFRGYQIIRELHRGGQGVVYQAIQKSTKRKVAIKVLREGPFADSRDRARFEREVLILGALSHPNIVPIHDSGSEAGQFYFVMDYISGQPLDVYMASGQRTIKETLQLISKICDGVNAAHLRGVIHRDLKPNNILISADGEPHVVDFGLAKVAMGGTTGDSQPQVMTVTGQFVGSLPWAAPEQAAGASNKMDVRTDVYSLGVILYQMLTGKFPYEVVGTARDVQDRIIQTEPVRPRKMRKQIDDEVETIVLKCLSKERERRYQSAGELARDVRRYLAGEPIEAKRDATLYVLRKHIRRHKLLSAFVGTWVVVLTFLMPSLFYANSLALERADRARVATGEAFSAKEAAERQAERAGIAEADAKRLAAELERVAQFQSSQLSEIDVELMGVGVLDALQQRLPDSLWRPIFGILFPLQLPTPENGCPHIPSAQPNGQEC